MKKMLMALCALMLQGAAFAQDAPIPNAGFEEGTTELVGWEHSDNDGGQGAWRWDTNNPRGGNRALTITKTNVAGYTVLVSDFLPVKPDVPYMAQCFVRVAKYSRANVYYMISQYSADSAAMRLPNLFGPFQPLYSTDGDWQPFRYGFTPREGTSRVRVHIVITAAPIEISLDDFELKEAGKEQYKPRYEPPTPETLMPMEDAVAHLKTRKKAIASRKIVGNRPRLFVDGKPLEPAFYVAPPWNGERAQVKDFKNAGVKLYFVPIVLGRGVYGDFGSWLGKGKTDFSEIEPRLWRILRADPDAYIMFYMATDPYLKWADEHPSEICTDQDGKKAVVDMHIIDWGREPREVKQAYKERYAHSYVSSVLRDDTSEVIRKLVRHVDSILPGKAVIGYHVAGGADGQFFQWTGVGPDGNFHLADYSPASEREFRQWLRRFYKNDASTLRRAWNRPNVSFDNATIPSGERRLAPKFFLDVKTDQDIADYNRFYSEGIMETILTYARVIKQESKGEDFVSTYYAGPASNIESHTATGRMLQSNDIDFDTGVAAYGETRAPGGQGMGRQTWASLMLHGRILIHEQDLRSWKTGFSTPERDLDMARVETAEEHNAIVRRESGMMLAFGHGTWWYDMSGGWFNDPGIMRGVREAREAFTRDLQNNATPRADVAVFVDERSQDYLGKPSDATFRFTAHVKQILALNQSGVPHHLFLQSDIANKSLPDYKLYIFLNAHHFSPDEWKAVQGLKRDGKVFLFQHAPGVAVPQNVGAKDAASAIAAVTGIEVKSLPENLPVVVNPLPAVRAAESPFNIGETAGIGVFSAPVWAVSDSKARPLGLYTNGETAVAARDFGNWKSVFFGGVGLSDSFINALARWTGAWVAAEAGDAVYANQHFLTAHAMWSGEKKLQFFTPSKVTDLSDGKVLAARASTLTVHIKRGETRWFYLEPVK